MHKNLLRTLLWALALTTGQSTALHAQDSIIGKYTGAYEDNQARSGGDRNVSVSLVVSSLEGQVVKGIGSVSGGQCPGDYIVEGKFVDSILEVKSTNRSARPGCVFEFAGNFDGNRLNGRIDGRDVQLRKR